MWTKLPSNGEAPQSSQDPMIQYYDGRILQAGGYPQGDPTCNPYLYEYSLTNLTWTVISDRNSSYSCRYLSRSFLYDDYFYMMFGWLTDDYADASDILRISLKSTNSQWETVFDNPEMGKDGFYSIAIGDQIYVFGGYYTKTKKKSNNQSEIAIMQ